MALTEYEKRITVKRWYFAVKLYFLGSLDALFSDLLKFLCFKDRKPGEGPPLPPTPPKKINGFARFTKMGRTDVGGGLVPPLAQPLTDIKLIKVGFICVAVTQE